MVLSTSAVTCGLLASLVSARAGRESSMPIVTLKNGSYCGVYSPQWRQDYFLGMPFAQNAERFSPARHLNTTWAGVRKAKAYPPHCVGFGGDMVSYVQSEDCLYLNIIRPSGMATEANLPVAVWIHGGGLVMGGSGDRRYNLSFLVSNSVNQGMPVIGVSLNYRLSAFGFLGGQAVGAGLGNIGFRDQRLALRWVHENIAAFGGSPDKVTIFGESAGAESVSAQVLAFNAPPGRDDGLFRAAIGQSGFGGFIPRSIGGLNATAAQQVAFDNLVRNTTSCAQTVGSFCAAIACLRTAPLDEVSQALQVAGAGPWPPVIDHDFIADYPSKQLERGRIPSIPLLVGANTDEGAGFGGMRSIDTDAEFAEAVRAELANVLPQKAMAGLVAEVMALYPDDQRVGIPSLETWPERITPNTTDADRLGLQYRRLNAFLGDSVVWYKTRRASLAWVQAGLPSYAYRFDLTLGDPRSGAAHFQEVAFVFHNVLGTGYAANPFANATQDVLDLALTMSSAWVNFVATLHPDPGLEPAWPPYSPDFLATIDDDAVGRRFVFATRGPGSFVELDTFRVKGIQWMIDHSLTLFGD